MRCLRNYAEKYFLQHSAMHSTVYAVIKRPSVRHTPVFYRNG